MKILKTSIVLLTFGLMGGCAANAPKELLDARAAYDQAKESPASQVTPADVANAKDALNVAETSFSDDGDTFATRSFAYVAQRKAEFAMARASVIAATQQKEQAEKDLVATATMTAEQRTKELASANNKLDKTADQLAAEKKAREEADKRAKDALARLAAIASVKTETRGLVITLPGGVLFETNKAMLLGTAQERLNSVADALIADRGATIVVEGHTDSQGTDALNDKLSMDRASSVRDYLVTRGVASDRISAVGKGSHNPVADNKSPEGRADNRRVEIVVQSASGDLKHTL